MADPEISENVVCNLCGQDNAAALFVAQERRIVRCSECGFVYVNPWIAEAGLYQEEAYFTQRNSYLARQDDFRVIFGRILDQIEAVKQGGRLLDVGCGPGLLLDVARERGWAVSGVEISEWAATYARDEMGIDVCWGELEDSEFPDDYFDVVVANHSLEHVQDPSAALRCMRRILKEDGVLAIGVPNFGSLMARLRGPRWRSLAPDQHRWHFTPRTLRQMLHKTGFSVFDISFENHQYGRTPLKKLIGQGVSWLSLKLHKGDAMLALADKPQA